MKADVQQTSLLIQNKRICHRFFEELLNKGRLSVIDELVDPNLLSHDPFPGQAPGSQGLKDTTKLFMKAFPDMRVIFKDTIAEGDKVMNRFTVKGTHKGNFMGIKPSGRKIAYEEIIILRLKDQKIVEHWALADALTLMQQIAPQAEKKKSGLSKAQSPEETLH